MTGMGSSARASPSSPAETSCTSSGDGAGRRSPEGGVRWEVGPLAASHPDRQFTEPCLVRVGSRLLLLIREETTGFLHQAESDDAGDTWTAPRPTPMWGCPPHVLALGDGRLLCVYGHRRPPYGIR